MCVCVCVCICALFSSPSWRLFWEIQWGVRKRHQRTAGSEPFYAVIVHRSLRGLVGPWSRGCLDSALSFTQLPCLSLPRSGRVRLCSSHVARCTTQNLPTRRQKLLSVFSLCCRMFLAQPINQSSYRCFLRLERGVYLGRCRIVVV